MLSPRAKAFSVQSLLAPTEGPDHKPPPPAHLAQNTALGENEAQWSAHMTKCDPNLAVRRAPRPEECCCDVEHTSLCRHPSVVTTAEGEGWTDGVVVRAELCHDDLWHAFHSLGTEMIITRAGRRMFPTIRLHVAGLEASALYRLSMEFAPCGLCKYRYVYHSSRWMVAGVVEEGEGKEGERIYTHPDSPLPGHALMSRTVTFERVKLTNSTCPAPGQVSLTSMQRFQPKIHIEKLSAGSGSDVTAPLRMTFIFPQTSFMAVTAYQNQQITRLKIARNPFAKGFRHVGKHKNSLPLLSPTLPVSLGWPSSSSLHWSTLQAPPTDDFLPWTCLRKHEDHPAFPGKGLNPAAEPTLYDVTTSPPGGPFHPMSLQDWNPRSLALSPLALFHPPLAPPPSTFPPQTESAPPLCGHHPPISLAASRAGGWNVGEACQEVTSEETAEIKDGVASSSCLPRPKH
ncbi:T-box transcription factor TBX20-like [Babylonia areolata]|uniref:T-box transcription factor TBX20-like n=1 Tax=Babylonia areolata TaxID=304850 RepID=UPI003FD1468D